METLSVGSLLRRPRSNLWHPVALIARRPRTCSLVWECSRYIPDQEAPVLALYGELKHYEPSYPPRRKCPARFFSGGRLYRGPDRDSELEGGECRTPSG